MRKTFVLRRLFARLALWVLPVVLAVGALLGIARLELRSRALEAGSLLVVGAEERAREVLATRSGVLPEVLLAPARRVPEARAAEALLSLVDGESSPDAVAQTLVAEEQAFPVSLMARSAFERGDFDTAARLSQVAECLHPAATELVATAAAVETGSLRGAAPDLSVLRLVPGELARRLQTHFSRSAGIRGTVLRDRRGELLGWVVDGELEMAEGVAPEIVPRAVVPLVQRHDQRTALRLSLDLELSRLALRALGRWYRGSIVMVDPASGEILVAVSDPRTFRGGGTPAFEQLREPASVAKLITTSAALRAGLDPDREIDAMTCRGHESYAGQRLYCPVILGPLRGLDHALATSCNVAFANLGVRVGREKLLEEFRRFGFDQPGGPFRHGRIVIDPPDDRSLADLSIGLENTDITPLHGALLAAVLANDGRIPAPRLVTHLDSRLGFHPTPFPASRSRRVLRPEWVPEIVEAMEAVAHRGTARRMAPAAFPVAMKTGTASHPRYGFHVNYVGFGPVPQNRLAFCVRVTDQPTSKKVRGAARSVTTRLLSYLARVAGERGWRETPGLESEPSRVARKAPARPSPSGSRVAVAP